MSAVKHDCEDKIAVEGISHVTLVVKDLERTARFLTSVFGAKEVYSSKGREYSLSEEKFFLIGMVWIAIMQGEALSQRTYNHIAFKIDGSEIEEYKRRLEGAKVDIRTGRSRVQGEGESLYFYDYDNHLFELHSGNLEERLKTYTEQKLSS